MAPIRPADTRRSADLRLTSAISLEDVAEKWTGGRALGGGIRVAVIDSGIAADHPDLHGCVDTVGSVAFTIDDEEQVTRVDGPHEDVFGHGTACAGIIHHLAPDATITSVRVLGDRLSGKAITFLAGLDWAIEQEFDVISLSLGTIKRDWKLPFYEACDRAYHAGSLVVTAANNIQRESYPSKYASVTSVACVEPSKAIEDHERIRRYHWNPDPAPDFLAHGIDVTLLSPEGGTTVGTGNSYAAPHISGLAAQIMSADPRVRPYHVKAALHDGAANVQEGRPAAFAGRYTATMTGIHASRGTRSSIFVRSGPDPGS
jgi:subtilisin